MTKNILQSLYWTSIRKKRQLETLGADHLTMKVNATILTGDSPNAFNEIDNPERVRPVVKSIEIRNGKVTIPAHSLIILEINR